MENFNCEKAMELLDSYIDGEITEHEHELLSAHLKHCESCRREYEALNTVHQYTRELAAELPEQLHETVMASIKKEPKRRATVLRYLRPLVAVSAAALVCVAVIHSPLFDMFRSAKSMEAANSTLHDNLYSQDGGSEVKSDAVAGIENSESNYAEELPELQDETVLNTYTIADTDLVLLILSENRASLCRGIESDTDTLFDFTYEKTENTIILETNGERQSLLIDGNRLIPKDDGTLLDSYLTD